MITPWFVPDSLCLWTWGALVRKTRVVWARA